VQAGGGHDGAQHHFAKPREVARGEPILEGEPDVSATLPRRPVFRRCGLVDADLVDQHAHHIDHRGDQRVPLVAKPLDQPLIKMRGGKQRKLVGFFDHLAVALAQDLASQLVHPSVVQIADRPHGKALVALEQHDPTRTEGAVEQFMHHAHPRPELARSAVEPIVLLPIADAALGVTPQAPGVAVADGVVGEVEHRGSKAGRWAGREAPML